MALGVSRVAAGDAVPPPVVFTAFAWDVLAPNGDLVLNFKSGGKPAQIGIAWRSRSVPMPCDGPGPLTFTRTVTRKGKPQEEPVAVADIPAGATRVLLVFGRNPATGGGALPYLVKAIDDSYAVFPGQSVRFINYSRMELGGTIGAKAFDVAPGADQVVSAELPPKNRLLPFRLARREAAGAWRRLRSTGLPMTAGLRVLVFLVENPAAAGRPDMVLLEDKAEDPKARP